LINATNPEKRKLGSWLLELGKFWIPWFLQQNDPWRGVRPFVSKPPPQMQSCRCCAGPV
jgi:hypothetical protein